MSELVKKISENEQLRADIYQLLAALFRRHPNAELLQFLASIEVENDDASEIAQAWLAVKLAAKQFTPEQLEDEYFNLFYGVGRGEIMPYGSWFMTGSLMDKPLAILRQELLQLGFEREEYVKEPEDHVAALCEVMSQLILELPSYRQLAFYQGFIESWIEQFCDDLAKAPSAQFYVAIAQLAKAFFVTESNEFAQIKLNIPTNCPAAGALQTEAITNS